MLYALEYIFSASVLCALGAYLDETWQINYTIPGRLHIIRRVNPKYFYFTLWIFDRRIHKGPNFNNYGTHQ